jgi:hypothetical protein
MIDEELTVSMSHMYRDGKHPSQILREIILSHPEASVPDLMKILQEAFSLPYTAVQCIGGWWHDGSGELTDTQLDSFLITEIQKALHSKDT